MPRSIRTYMSGALLQVEKCYLVLGRALIQEIKFVRFSQISICIRSNISFSQCVNEGEE